MFIGLVVGGVFLGFCRGGWLVVEVEIGVAGFVFRRWRCLNEFGLVSVVFFFLDVDLYVYFLDLLGLIYSRFMGLISWIYWVVYEFDFLDLLGLIWGRT